MKKNKNAKCFAFTLAEVLITLVIIGVIAAITIPNLITAYQKHVVETKVVKFYSMINNAMKLSTIDNGPIEDWAGGFILNNNFSITKMQEFADKYFTPYINYYKIEQSSSGSVSYYLPDNSRFYIFCDVNGFDIVYYPFGKASRPLTHSMFGFQLYKRDLVSNNKMNSKNFVEPYTYEWNGTLATLKAGGKNGGNWACNKNATWPVYCTKLLQMNNWKITKDYPW